MSEPILPISHLEIRFLETLASFIENALKPLAKALAPYGSLAMWEVANELEVRGFTPHPHPTPSPSC